LRYKQHKSFIYRVFNRSVAATDDISAEKRISTWGRVARSKPDGVIGWRAVDLYRGHRHCQSGTLWQASADINDNNASLCSRVTVKSKAESTEMTPFDRSRFMRVLVSSPRAQRHSLMTSPCHHQHGTPYQTNNCSIASHQGKNIENLASQNHSP
jgi:hypothetical protein